MRTSSSLSLAVLSICLFTVPFGSSAHHSRAHFSTEFTELVGELVDMKWRNPHVYFVLRTTVDGRTQVWEMEAASLYTFTRAGVSRDVFPIGEQVRVAGNVSTTRPGEFLATNMLLPSGQEIVTIPNGAPRWGANGIGGRQGWVADDELLQNAEPGERGIFRVWSAPQYEQIEADLPFTEAALAARADWDVDANFISRCEPPGMPGIISTGQPHPFQLVDQGDMILFLGEEFDIVRTIHMDGRAAPDDEPSSRLGYSIGYWDGEDTLVVETTRIDWPYFDRIGTPQSELVQTVERFTLSPDGQELSYQITVADPQTFTAPATVRRRYLDLGETIEPYDCEVAG